MQEQMQRLQQQLEASQNVSPSSSTQVPTAGSSAGPKPMTTKPTPPRQPTFKRTPAKPASTTQKARTPAGRHVVVHQPKSELLWPQKCNLHKDTKNRS